MHFICDHLPIFLKLLIYFWVINCTWSAIYALPSINSSLSSSINLKPDQITQYQDEDLLIFSSWKTLKYWTSNSRLHSPKVLDKFEVFHPNVSKSGKIAAIDFYTNQTICQNVLIWCELNTQTIYSSLIQTKDEKLYLTESTKLLQMSFGTHIRLAIDSTNNNIYLSLYDFSRIDVFDVERKTLKTFLTNTSHPVDIAIDNNQHILFWIENGSCISQTSITNINITRMCSINARALALDSLNDELFWSDSSGDIFRRKYFETSAQKVFSAKKMKQNLALGVTAGAIYISDLYKLHAFNRSTLEGRVVLIESPAILVFKSISRKSLCERPEEDEPEYNITLSDITSSNIKINYKDELSKSVLSNVITKSPFNRSLTLDSNENFDETESYSFESNKWVYIIIFLVLIVLTSVLLVFIAFKRFYKKNRSNRTQIKRITPRKPKRFFLSDKNKLLGKDVNKTVCIEDLGSFSNNGYLDPQTFCSNCPIKQTCSSCDDKDECLERGICLTTYKLLT